MSIPSHDYVRLQTSLGDLTAALESHLAAVSESRGEADPAVQAAYTRLRAAAERYDNLLYDLADEVTPWEFTPGPPLDVEYQDSAAEPDHVSVLVRRDYLLADPASLLVAGREAHTELNPDEPAEAANADVNHAGRAMYQLLQAYGVDGLDHRAEQSGLAMRGGTVWVQALPPADTGAVADEPFAVADEQLLIYRLDEVVEPNQR